MKKSREKLMLVLVVIVIFWVSGCSQVPTTILNVGDSSRFSDGEMLEAADLILNSRDDFIKNSRISHLTYDESESEGLILSYLPSFLESNSQYEQYEPENILFFSSKIKTGRDSGSLEPLSTYDEFYWILVKEHNWQIIYAGFLN
ncbi:hypothetical protein [Vagococcus salmoninarum]|uniref:hypothetical protein n=1 Tax=Vagococcus salmoninarum TaxID=2739 RepID=UPI003F94C742